MKLSLLFKAPSRLPLSLEIVLAGLLVALAVVLAFASFSFGAGKIYFVGIAVFIMPWVLRPGIAVIGALASVALADLISGWILYTWISFVAYGLAVLVMAFVAWFKFKWWRFTLTLILASILVVLVYFGLELAVFGLSLAIADLIATSVQMSITFGAALFSISLIRVLILRLYVPRWSDS